jgi:hypothetical protein
LVSALGENLAALILFGEYVTPNALDSGRSPVSLMLVLEQIDCGYLDRIVAPIAKAEREIPLATMTVTPEDVRSSCDVFPVKFHYMQMHHRLLFGRDVLSELQISNEHLRLRCEQELKNLLIRLRAMYLHRGQSTKKLFQTLVASLSDLVRNINACLAAKSAIVPEDNDELVATFGAEFGLDVTVITELLQLRRNRQTPGSPDVKRMFDAFMRLVHDAAQAVDQLEIAS